MILRILKWIGWLVSGLVVLLALFATERYFTLQGSLPDYDATIVADGLSAPVSVLRDAHAIPHIEARSLADAGFAMGVVHAQDRLWQMTFLRRVGQGRLAELFGSVALDVDRTIRALDLAGLARSSFESLKPETQALLEAYAWGVNSRIIDRDRPLPPEFFLVQTTPEPWAAEDSLILMSMLGLGLSTNAFTELARLDLAQALEPAQIADLMAPFPGLPEGVDLTPFLRPEEDAETTVAAASLFPPLGASNNWVVDGSRSATGAPLLANDPHLGLLMPGLWYLVDLRIDGRGVTGATLPGIPTVLMGQTDDLAWGITNTGTDVQDLVLERLDPEDPNRYLTPDGSRAFEAREARFKVRFGEDVTETLRRSRHGPVLPILADRAPDGHAWTVMWTGLSPQNRTFEVSVGILGASSLTDIQALIGDYVVPTQNFVFADREGAIGFMAAGAVPIRHPDVPGGGLVPVAGWAHREIWTGFLEPSEWPQIWAPAEGRLATANSDIRPPGYDRFITAEWNLPWRAQRIVALLDDQETHDLDSFAAIMGDHRTGLRDRLFARMLSLMPDDPGTADLRARLGAWDGVMAADRAEPLIMVAWMSAFASRLAGDELADLGGQFMGLRPIFFDRVLADENGAGRWCDDQTTPQKETCPDLLGESLTMALADLEKRFGSDPDTWRWGEAHTAAHGHMPFGAVPGLSGLFSRTVETAGGTYTISRGSYAARGANPFANGHGASYRALYDLKTPARSRFMISTGQSGNPYSPHYDDKVTPWGAGSFFEIERSMEKLMESRLGLMRLTPAGDTSPGDRPGAPAPR